MKPRLSTLCRSRSRLFRAGGVGVLLLHLCAGTPAAPLFAALLATVDRGHQVLMQQGAGGLQLVLHHDGASPGRHRHRLLAHVLASFAEGDATPHSDHVLQFGTAPTVPVAPPDLASASPAPEELSKGDIVGGGSQVSLPCFHEFRRAFARPPPPAAGSLLAIRFTVLLL